MRPPHAQSRYTLATFCLIITVGASALLAFTYLATPVLGQSQAKPAQAQQVGSTPPAEPKIYFFGNKITTPTAWKMPANTLFATTFVTTQAMSGNLLMTLFIVPYSLGENTQLHLGLYINGVLKSSNTVNASQSHAPADSMVGQAVDTPTGQVANFTQNSQGYQAALGPITNPFPTGTTVTLIAFSSSPIWVKTTQVGSGHSFELSGTTALPKILPNTPPATTVPDLCIQGEANAA